MAKQDEQIKWVKTQKSNGRTILLIPGTVAQRLAPVAITVTLKAGRSDLVWFDGEAIHVGVQLKAIGESR